MRLQTQLGDSDDTDQLSDNLSGGFALNIRRRFNAAIFVNIIKLAQSARTNSLIASPFARNDGTGISYACLTNLADSHHDLLPAGASRS